MDFKNTVLVLNAPPLAGKDTIADYLMYNHSVCKEQLKTSLYEITSNILGVSKETVIAYCTDRTKKEVPCKLFKDKSPRDFLIYLSETVLKPYFGNDVLGSLAANRMDFFILQNHGYVFSDGGYGGTIDELMPVVEKFKNNVVVCRIHRSGCSFKGDTRAYLTEQYLSTYGIHSFDFINDCVDTKAMLISFMNRFKNEN